MTLSGSLSFWECDPYVFRGKNGRTFRDTLAGTFPCITSRVSFSWATSVVVILSLGRQSRIVYTRQRVLMVSPPVLTLSRPGKLHKKASESSAWGEDARCASEYSNASSSCVTQVPYIHCILRVHSKAGRCAFSDPYFFKLKLASLFKLNCALHDVGASLPPRSSAPRKTAVHASVRMEIAV